jgi:anion-transporting  ArsA/GET3 family ATPase
MSSDKTDADNNILSDTTDVVSDTESVEIEDFEEVHAQLVQIQRTHEEALAILERIKALQQDQTMDLEEIIEDLHQKALTTISETGQNPFSAHLLAMIDSIKN